MSRDYCLCFLSLHWLTILQNIIFLRLKTVCCLIFNLWHAGQWICVGGFFWGQKGWAVYTQFCPWCQVKFVPQHSKQTWGHEGEWLQQWCPADLLPTVGAVSIDVLSCSIGVAAVFLTSRVRIVLCNTFVCKPQEFMELFGANIRKLFPQTPSVSFAFGAQCYSGSEWNCSDAVYSIIKIVQRCWTPMHKVDFTVSVSAVHQSQGIEHICILSFCWGITWNLTGF